MTINPLNDAFYFRSQIDALSERIFMWFETAEITAEDDFDDELPIGDILYWYGDRMNGRERRRLTAMIRLWE